MGGKKAIVRSLATTSSLKSVKVRDGVSSEVSAKADESSHSQGTDSVQSATIAELNKRSAIVRSIYAKARQRLQEEIKSGGDEENKLDPRQKLQRAASLLRESAKQTMFSKNAIESFLRISDDHHERQKLQAEVEAIEAQLQKEEEPLHGFPALLGEITGLAGSQSMSETQMKTAMANMHRLQDNLSGLKDQFQQHRRHAVKDSQDLHSAIRDVQTHLDSVLGEFNAMRKTLDEASQRAFAELADSEQTETDAASKDSSNENDEEDSQSEKSNRLRQHLRSAAIAMVFDQVLFHDFLGNIRNLASDVNALSEEEEVGISLDVSTDTDRRTDVAEEPEKVDDDAAFALSHADGTGTFASDMSTPKLLDRSADASLSRSLNQTARKGSRITPRTVVPNDASRAMGGSNSFRAMVGRELESLPSSHHFGLGAVARAGGAAGLASSHNFKLDALRQGSMLDDDSSYLLSGYGVGPRATPRAMGESSTLRALLTSEIERSTSSHHFALEAIRHGYVVDESNTRAPPGHSKHLRENRFDSHPSSPRRLVGWGSEFTDGFQFQSLSGFSRNASEQEQPQMRCTDGWQHSSLRFSRTIGEQQASQMSCTDGFQHHSPRRFPRNVGEQRESPRISQQRKLNHCFNSSMATSSMTTKSRLAVLPSVTTTGHPQFVVPSTASASAISSSRFAVLSDSDSEDAHQQIFVPSRVMASTLSPHLPRLLSELHPDCGIDVVDADSFSKTSSMGFGTDRPNMFQSSTIERVIEERKRKNLRYKDLWKGESMDFERSGLTAH